MPAVLFVLCLSLLAASFSPAHAFVVDHESVAAFDRIPDEWIIKAKRMLRVAFGHTSHGSQIVTGMQMLASENDLYRYTTDTSGFLCDGCLHGARDLGSPSRVAWFSATRAYLNRISTNSNVIMWSWCGQVSNASSNAIAVSYLENMARLEEQFPDVHFVYMTGHLDGTGDSGNLRTRNKQIRDYAIANNKILFDFADIESWNPKGVYFPDETDECTWCTDWCANHACPPCTSCLHSHCFNCYQKGKAFWYMMARLAGWDGTAKKKS